MPRVGTSVTRISKAPATNIEHVGILTNKVFWVDGMVPGLETDITEDDAFDAAIGTGFG
jgi:hypothetical protein